MKKHLFFFLVLSVFTFHFSPLLASDWVLNEDKYYAWHYTDHLYLEVFLADLDGGNTYCKEGTLRATNGSKTVDLLTLKYINEGDDECLLLFLRVRLQDMQPSLQMRLCQCRRQDYAEYNLLPIIPLPFRCLLSQMY